jgi:hypothetical protein
MGCRQRGTSDLNVTLIGFGAIRKGRDTRFNRIDTPSVYWLNHSEDFVAPALEVIRNRPYVVTKSGMIQVKLRRIGQSLKAFVVMLTAFVMMVGFVMAFVTVMVVVMADSIRRECESNLKRSQMIGPIASHQPPYPMEITFGKSIP